MDFAQGVLEGTGTPKLIFSAANKARVREEKFGEAYRQYRARASF
jgi:hypothetical protein